jgi:hypothetical protein
LRPSPSLPALASNTKSRYKIALQCVFLRQNQNTRLKAFLSVLALMLVSHKEYGLPVKERPARKGAGVDAPLRVR